MIGHTQQKNLILIFSCFLAILPLNEHLSFISAGVIYALFVWRVVGTVRPEFIPRVRVMQAVAVLAVVVALVVGASGRGLTLDVIMTALCLALALKLFEISKARDMTIVYAFDLLVIGIDLCYRPNGYTWILSSLSFSMLVLAMVSFQYKDKPVSKAVWSAAKILVLIVPISAIFCFLLPAEALLKWSIFDSAKQSRTGMSDSMSPGDVSSLMMSDEIAFVGRFKNKVPEKDSLYWRAVVLDHFDGAQWSSTNGRSVTVLSASDAPSVKGVSVEYELDLEPTSGQWLPALDTVLSIVSRGENATIYRNTETLELKKRTPYNKTAKFDVLSNPDVRRGWVALPGRSKYLQVPEGNPRSRLLAKSLLDSSDSETDLVSDVLAMFHNENFYYTLSPRKLGKIDQVDEFLFESREGFCEHYASAFVFLLRSAGIPSRVVTGYQGASYFDRASGKFEVRQSEAHAWAEYWTANKGWVRADPTAALNPSRIAPKPKKSAFALAFSRVVKFMGSAPSLFKIDPKELLGSQTKESSSEAEEAIDKINQEKMASDKTALYITAAGITGCVVLLAFLIYARRKYELATRDKTRFLLREFCYVMSEVGFKRGEAETLMELSKRASQHNEQSWVILQKAFTDMMQNSIYGREGLDDARVAEIRRVLDMLRGRLPMRKRLLVGIKTASDIYR
jgi:transglutaminase-like putative cysteine protease